MKKVKIAIQATALVLAFPLWFFAEMKHVDRSVKANQHLEHIDSINTKKEVTFKEDKSGDGLDLQTIGMQKLMVVCN